MSVKSVSYKQHNFIIAPFLIAQGTSPNGENNHDPFILPSQGENSKNSCDGKFNDILSRTARDANGNRIESKLEQKTMGLDVTFAQGSPFHKLVLKLLELHGKILKFGTVKGGNANQIDKSLKDLFDGLTSLKHDCKNQLSYYQKTVLMGKLREVVKLKGQWENLQIRINKQKPIKLPPPTYTVPNNQTVNFNQGADDLGNALKTGLEGLFLFGGALFGGLVLSH